MILNRFQPTGAATTEPPSQRLLGMVRIVPNPQPMERQALTVTKTGLVPRSAKRQHQQEQKRCERYPKVARRLASQA